MFVRNLLAAGALALAGLTTAHASLVSAGTDGSWNQFDVTRDLAADGGVGWIDINDGSALSFQFTVNAGFVGTLTVVDTGFAGDRFSVSINGNPLLPTSTAVNSYPTAIGQADFDAALANADYSRGIFSLGAGTYTVTGALFASALDGAGMALDATSGGLKVDVSPVPLPPALLLLASGLGMLGTRLRRRASTK